MPMTLPMDSKILTIFEGTSEIQRMLIGRTITGHAAIAALPPGRAGRQRTSDRTAAERRKWTSETSRIHPQHRLVKPPENRRKSRKLRAVAPGVGPQPSGS
jgi:hypothetical protein